MNDTPSTPLTDQALARLRKLAAGNGFSPDAIQLVSTEEKIYELEGTLTLTPKTDVQQGRYAGPPKGKGRQILPDGGALKNEIESRRQKFAQGRDWIPEALNELKAHETHGWGLQDAEVTMPERTVILAAPTPCPVCHGQKLVTCPQCGGQGLIICVQCRGTRQEPCYTCGGTGRNPQDPNQPCLMCNGMRFVTCRRCQGRGQMTCPMCHGQRGTPCPNCKGTGQITEEAALTFSAATRFVMKSQGLPSGLRRGLDRLGIVNLGKGHADIELAKPKTQDEAPPEMPADTPKAREREKPDNTPPLLHYIAKLPYADIKLKFGGGRVVVVSAFGKRAVLLGVPPFLDDALNPARVMLRQAVTNGTALEGALKARAIREALELELGGKTVKDFRRLYPVGLSGDAANEIMSGLRQAMQAFTLRLRSMVAIAGGVVSGGIFGTLFLTDIHAEMMQNVPAPAVFFGDLFILMVVLALNILALGATSRMVLQRRFPHLRIALQTRMGAIDYVLLAAVTFMYVAVLFFAPLKPGWLMWLLH